MYPIVKKEKLADKIYLMDVKAPRVAQYCEPGQFVIVKIDEQGERIPLTICDYNREAGTITIVFQTVGASTQRMVSLEQGDAFADFVGPLGCPSDLIDEDIEELKKKKIVFIAGGVGTAPVYPQVKWLHEHGVDCDVIMGSRNKDLLILEDEMRCTDKCEDDVWKELENRYDIMKNGTTAALGESGKRLRKTMITGMAERQFSYAENGNSLCGVGINKMMARAISLSETNAAMGKICAAPTAGSCGILPAVLVTMEEEWNLSKRKILEGLLIASGIGAVVVKNATVAGAEGGCQAECGVAAAMAAAAVVYLAGGTCRQQAAAVSLALINVMGLVCDPIAGLVQIPCAQRNASQAVNAIVSADLALADTVCPVPADEAIEAMYRVGKQLPRELRETALGGIAESETGKRIADEIRNQ